MIEQYRDELMTSLQGSIDESRVAEDREAVASDLLNILHRCASSVSRCLFAAIEWGARTAAYRFSPSRPTGLLLCVFLPSRSAKEQRLISRRAQVHKVRFVASTLLDAVRKAETAPASAARAHAYLCA